LYEIPLEPRSSNDEYEAAFADAIRRLRAQVPAVRRIAFGDLFLEDVRAYRERLVAPLGLEPIFPLWMRPTRELAEQFVREGYHARLVCVDTTQLDAEFAGRVYDSALLADLPTSVDPCGERGEFHTFVADGPVFTTPVPYATGERVLRDERFAYCDLVM
jgi:uncharacterized protein (TIGR00290 family)